MPLVRKIVAFGKSSRGIILPKSWLFYYEKQSGHKIEQVSIEVDGKLTIKPFFEEGSDASK